MRILIAEDDPISRRLLEAMLIKWGYETIACCDGGAALSQLEGDEPPEIAILDWMMPEIDGVEVCRRIRAKPVPLPVYIMLLTAKRQREDLIAGLQAGADDYLTKPFDAQELRARLQVGVRISDLQHKLSAQVVDLEVALGHLHTVQQSQKLEAIGRLASGVAHEINTPIQYVGDNLRFLQNSWQEIQKDLPSGTRDPRWDKMIAEIPRAIEQSLEGVLRVGKIVRSIRDFARPSTDGKTPTDLNRVVETIVNLATSELRDVAEIQTDLAPQLPLVECLSGELHHVLLNLVVNAAQAIADKVRNTAGKGLIRITTSLLEDCVEIRVSDTGTGIREEHRSRIFEPFFSTKEVGKGTGQALAIARQVIVQQHCGKMWFETESGIGTTFVIQVPIG
jgi:signal transduction histidine kinase